MKSDTDRAAVRCAKPEPGRTLISAGAPPRVNFPDWRLGTLTAALLFAVDAALLQTANTGLRAAEATSADDWRTETERRWNSIVTWRGIAVIEESHGGAAPSRHWTCEFVIDRSQRCLRWINSAADRGALSAGIIKHGRVYQIADRGHASNGIVSVTRLADPEVHLTFVDSDPVAWLTDGIMSTPAAFLRPGGTLGLDSWQVSGSLRESLTLHRPGRDVVVVVDPESGHIASVRAAGAGFTEETTLRWEQHPGVRVPVESLLRRVTADGRTIERRTKIRESIVNEPISPDEWLLSAIGVKDGDLVRDQAREVQFVYHGASVALLETADDSAYITMCRVILNIAAWIVILGVILFIRRRRHSSELSVTKDAVED